MVKSTKHQISLPTKVHYSRFCSEEQFVSFIPFPFLQNCKHKFAETQYETNKILQKKKFILQNILILYNHV